jgi:hypothetical protein
MLTGHPSETTVVLRRLIEDRPSGDWWKLVYEIIDGAIEPEAMSVDARLENDRWKLLRGRLDKVRPFFVDADCEPFVYWAPDVARFSFESSRVLVGQPERPAAQNT